MTYTVQQLPNHIETVVYFQRPPHGNVGAAATCRVATRDDDERVSHQFNSEQPGLGPPTLPHCLSCADVSVCGQIAASFVLNERFSAQRFFDKT